MRVENHAILARHEMGIPQSSFPGQLPPHTKFDPSNIPHHHLLTAADKTMEKSHISSVSVSFRLFEVKIAHEHITPHWTDLFAFQFLAIDANSFLIRHVFHLAGKLLTGRTLCTTEVLTSLSLLRGTSHKNHKPKTILTANFSAPVTSVPPPKEYDKKSSSLLSPPALHEMLPASMTLLADENETTRHSLPCLLAAPADARTTALERSSRAPDDMLWEVSRHITRGPPGAEGSRALRLARGSGKVGTSVHLESS